MLRGPFVKPVIIDITYTRLQSSLQGFACCKIFALFV
jgi:hypothetical protein